MQRSEKQLLQNRIKVPKPLIQVLVGARQIGKSTLVQQVLKDLTVPFIYESADGVTAANNLWIEQLWNRARQLVGSSGSEVVLAIDEIQKIHQWSETVKKLWDEDRTKNTFIKIILLGSSKLILQQGLTESLAGRFELIRLSHWKFNEMREAFGFTPEQYVYFGAYPGAANFINEETRWKNYVRDSLIETAISKDILMLNRVDKPALLLRLFETGSQYSGQILSYNKLMGQLQDAGNTTTLAHYLNLMDQAEILCGLEKYSGNSIRRKSSSPRFQTYNTALVNAQSNESFTLVQTDPAKWGRLVESAVGAHLLAFTSKGLELFYWREGNNEVDFVLQFKNKIVAIEVKTGANTKSGMSVFQKKYNPFRVYLVGTGGIPWQEFLSMNPLELF